MVFIFVLIKRLFHLSPGRTLLCLFSDFIQYQRRQLCPWLISIIFLKSWFFMIYSKVTFQPSVGSETEDPVFQRGAVFIYAYQPVTSESNIKSRFFFAISSTISNRPGWSPPPAPDCFKGASESLQYWSEIPRQYQSHHRPKLAYTHILRRQHQWYVSKVGRFS